MAFSPNLQDREQDKFVESPIRSGKTSVEVYVVNSGDFSGAGSTNTTATIKNETLTLANTEYSFALPANCKGFVFKPQKIVRLSFSYSSGGPYLNCGLGSGFVDSNKYLAQTIYIKSDTANSIIDLLTYV